ncbi:uncharacterized protein LOC106150931 [Lingula anatina]|uniref:Uncharacterized protein LOC106150931 n=1 Tax=Lingula anatina TaxID=7574 RepID=A0A1S3H081_LINAN|nr:uncharacterized protein LOC106150931 [Lingula anatina]|eukprot:XP_013379413.1 uncharacterized protein LOC106150931 [Lingula anatina]
MKNSAWCVVLQLLAFVGFEKVLRVSGGWQHLESYYLETSLPYDLMNQVSLDECQAQCISLGTDCPAINYKPNGQKCQILQQKDGDNGCILVYAHNSFSYYEKTNSENDTVVTSKKPGRFFRRYVGYKMPAHLVIVNETVLQRTICAFNCMVTPLCMSFSIQPETYGLSYFCELNSARRNNNGSNLLSDSSFYYFE